MDQDLNGFQLTETADGSPTLTMVGGVDRGESMHSREGAFTESLYIYHEAVAFVTKMNWPLYFASVGLGLGYNELIIAGHLIKEQRTQNIYLESFEKNPTLADHFRRWIVDESAPINSLLKASYAQILEKTSEHFSLNPFWIKSFLKEKLEAGEWKIRSALGPETEFAKPFSCILYDAYSQRTSPELWREEMLRHWLGEMAAPNCVLATYAATGSLNRALRTSGFLMEDKKGFAGKRESTFAVRVHSKLTPGEFAQSVLNKNS